jgi:hypothetical protein
MQLIRPPAPVRFFSKALRPKIEYRSLSICFRIHRAATGPGLQQVQPSDVTDFVKDRLATLRDLLDSDVTQARAELLRRVGEIRLKPSQTDTGGEYVAEGEWNLLRTYPEEDRARHLLGVRARLVARAGALRVEETRSHRIWER